MRRSYFKPTIGANMAQTVTELVVRGDGALAVLDRFEQGMENAGRATDQTTGAVADFERRMASARAAIERGNSVTTQSIERKTAEQRAWDRWSATVDKSTALRIRLEREAARAAVDAANAVNLGYASQEQALSTLIALEQRHAAQLQGVTDQSQRVAQSAQQAVAANDNLARSMSRVASSAQAGTFQTSNIAAQFQDIGVTAAMGMNPIMIALQQGTQLSAVLNTMQNPLRGLAMAFVSIINPVSLLTIGFVALTAAAVQFFMSSGDDAKKAETALEAHDKWLDEILVGYKNVREAARLAGEEAQRLPQAEVQLSLDADAAARQAEYADALAKVQVQILATNTNQQTLTTLWMEGGDAALEQRDALLAIQDAAMAANPNLDELALSLKSFIQDNPDSVLRGIADAMLENVLAARSAEVAYRKVNAAAQELRGNSDPRQFMPGVADAIDEITRKTVDLRTEQERLDEQFRNAAAGARTISELNALVSAYDNMQRAAQAAAWAVKNSGDAAVVAAGQYGTATGAANAYANALWALGNMIPQVAAAQAAMAQMQQAEEKHTLATSAAGDLLRMGAINRAEYNERISETTQRLEQAKDAISGVTALEEQLATQTVQNSIDALTGREQALARVKLQYADQAKAIEAARATGAKQADVDRLLAQNSDQLAAALANTNAQFERQASSAGAKGAASALKQYERDLNSVISTADKAAEKLFPGEYARREAMELMALLDQYRDKLDSFQTAGMEKEIADLNTAADQGLRRLEDRAKEAGNEIQQTLGKVLSDLFSKPITDLDELLDRMMSGFAQIGQSNLSKLFSGDALQSMFGGPAANDNGPTPVNITNPGDISQKFGEFFKGSGGITSMASAGLGGLGIGYQTQSPIMGGLGGAASGAMAGMAMGPMGMAAGAVIGGLAGVVGGIFGMNKALEEAKQKLNEARVGIDQLMATMSGEKISAYAKAAADFEQQTIQAIALAEKAGDFELGARIQAAYDKAGQTLARELNREIERNINALRGQDYINEASDALELYNSRLRDQVALGQDVVGAQDELVLSLQKLVKDTALTGAQLDDLARRFPELADALSKISLETSKMTGRLLDAQYGFMIEARAEVDRARGDLQRAYEAEAGQLRDIISAAQKAAQSLRQFRDSLKLDQNLSYLNPVDRLRQAQDVFRDVSTRAVGGDAEAIGQLEGVSRQYLEEARAYYATSSAYFDIAREVEGILDQTLATAEGQVTEAQRQLTALTAQVELLGVINNSVLTVADAIRNLEGALGALKQREEEYYSGSGGYNRQVTDLYRDVLGRAPDANGAAYYSAMLNSGMSMEELRRKFILNAQPELERGYPSYAVGTDFHPGGMAWVGEQGRELVNLPRGAQVIPHQQSMAIAGNDNREVVAELRRVNARLESIERTTASGAQAQVAATGKTTAAFNDQAEELNRIVKARRA
jgi:hypothetical protein